MAKIARFQFPDGKIGKFEVPDDYTPEQAQSEIEANVYGKSQEQIQQPSNENRLYGLGGRAAIEGVAGIPAGVYNFASTVSHLPDIVRGKKIPKTNEWGVPSSINTQQYGTKLADYLGLPQPTESEQKPMEYARLGIGTLAGGGIVKALGGAIPSVVKAIAGANAPIVNTIGALGGKAGSEYAGQVFDKSSPGTKTAAQIAGGVLGGGLTSGISSMVQPTTRAAGRLGNLAIDNLEGVAGRALNRQAGSEAEMVQQLLDKGKIPNLEDIEEFKPRSSDIAGNSGISALARQVENSNVAGTDLGTRRFENTKAIKSSLVKATGTEVEKADTQAFLDKLNQDYTQEMRARNAPVDVSNINSVFESAIAKHNGNPSITTGLEVLQRQLDAALAKDPDAGFNTILNFKQNIDAQLRANPMADPTAGAVQKSATALKDLKRELTDALTKAEPDYRDIAQMQAIGIKHQGEQKTLSDLLKKATNSIPLVSNASGVQEELLPLSAATMSKHINDADIMRKLSPYQQEKYKNATQATLAGTRARQGMAVGSNTAQNISLDTLLMEDIARAASGTDKGGKAGILSGPLKILDKPLSMLTDRTDELSAILAQAELDPAYAAMLMKKYKLSGPIDMSTPAGRAALYGALTQYQNSNR